MKGARMRRILFALSLAAALSACGPTNSNPPPDTGVSDDAPPTADAIVADEGSDAAVPDSPVADAATDARDAQAGDASADGSSAPFITEALDCRFDAPGGPGSGDMQRHSLDLTRFPDALCNDGTGAVLHFRPARGAANRNKWVISLRGGGSCISGIDCASRYCGCSNARAAMCPGIPAENRTNFTADNMSNTVAALLPGRGVILRDGGPTMVNPLADYNHVYLQYCTSDVWSGTRRDAVLDGVHPRTGAPLRYRVHFLGSRVLDADIATLRRDGVSALVHAGTATQMPDLDDAEEVVFTGDSAGGIGLVQNLDRLATTLRASNTRCAGATCPLRVSSLIDASTGPDMSRLDFSMTDFGTYATFLSRNWAAQTTYWGVRTDESCVEYHRSRSPGSESSCSDFSHTIRHHVTSPFFVRMALLDGLIFETYRSLGLRDSMMGPLSGMVFAQTLGRELAGFPMLSTTAEEGASIRTPSGVFAPLCTDHDTIFEDVEVYGTSITLAGTTYKLFDVFDPWRTAGTARAIVPLTPTATTCRM
ncbi:MAG: hypothetical protein JNK05_33610 [Myxococcales bacterium]|nr:hypothetical protein [Myxococcales bacterium]